MESEVLAERILLDLENAFKKDPLIDEFDILPVNDSVLNKCPVILAVHKLGLESWCVRHVYLYVYTRFIKWRQHPHKIEPSVLLSWTTALLLLNPDLATAWNCRKELFQTNKISAKDELKFSELVLGRKPKSPQLFAHRKWILSEALKGDISSCTLKEIIDHELKLCAVTADKYSNNYYVWNHRMWILQHLLHFCSIIVLEELQATEQWVSTHVSDHSGFHYRQFLIKCQFTLPNNNLAANDAKLCLHDRSLQGEPETSCYRHQFTSNTTKNNELVELLKKELHLLSQLQMIYPGHETLWNHRRFIIHELLQLPDCAKLPSSCSPSMEPNNPALSKKYKLESGPDLTAASVISSELEFIHKSLAQSKNEFWEHKLAVRHEAWLRGVVMAIPVCLPHM